MARRPTQTPDTDQIEFSFDLPAGTAVETPPASAPLNRKQRRAELKGKQHHAPATSAPAPAPAPAAAISAPATPAPAVSAPAVPAAAVPAPVAAAPAVPVEKPVEKPIVKAVEAATPVVEAPRVAAPRPVATKPAPRLTIKPADARQPTPFEKLLHAELARVFNFCLRLTQDSAKAEDLAQDVFVRAGELLPEATSAGPSPLWLTRKAIALFLKDRRYNRPRRPVVPPTPENAPPAPAVYELPDAWAGVGEDHRLLLSALGTVDAKDRVLLVLKDIEGRSYAEVGEVLEQSEAATRSRVSSARARLHAAVKKILDQRKP